ncbi:MULTISPECIES: hypothetical protein [Streptomycetaceae]|uniref:Uncharacterized protein n=1 Tax=Streptantibioticus cattleyicolor (strain ATCC 35852 / DSM 46488 / JCM 4925 / NBRC 14057 / NRRL 8057) TaxID=1003195 RepID=F8K3G4_STREN|nr:MULTISPECIES: hypothetical protein [Streptomycetaceae]AEW95084.1 hypothetical protein SCATT_27130 [Streptantibioticus cattleyicolor NRRL 8057 = DSM 46488]CCB75432.1 conserved exported protein of unknown function [Streptantibioticus cattleyicolor NRRL 8057 = DSM 46488]
MAVFLFLVLVAVALGIIGIVAFVIASAVTGMRWSRRAGHRPAR